MGVLNGNNPVHRGRLLRQTVNGHTGTRNYAASTGDPSILAHFTDPRTPEGHPNCQEMEPAGDFAGEGASPPRRIAK
jgi:hypothetical protein